ncbi:hypothetical protein BJV77DRAFT_1150232 [Russula vinacea]|nr:hypothetical protein BJV77DRAFT_1150232 [Russula vinacea]
MAVHEDQCHRPYLSRSLANPLSHLISFPASSLMSGMSLDGQSETKTTNAQAGGTRILGLNSDEQADESGTMNKLDDLTPRYDPTVDPVVDPAENVNGMYRLLDLIGESGSNGYVDKVVIAQNSLQRFINDLSPGHMRLSQGSISKHWIVLR